MAFFGLTGLSDGNTMETIFKRQAARNLDLHQIPDEEFERLFLQYSLSNQHTMVDKTAGDRLKLDPAQTMVRSDLAKLLSELIGDTPTNVQMEAFLTFFNTDTSGCISIEEYRRSYASIKRVFAS
mmetsp:Transcript_31959/g.60115  ORF Transcript_31959/g.60115 Transcript_31959/m.60115 type:complete len:125 (-) Transcript_31959:1510-1884(-)